MKRKTPEQELKELREDIIRERNHWNYINEHGCNDPFWPDGCNLNHTRNHIIADRKRIEMLCEEHEELVRNDEEACESYMAKGEK